MKTMYKVLYASAAAFVLAAAPLGAEAQDSSQAYASIGYSQLKSDDMTLGAVTGRAGYKFNAHFGVEAEASLGVDKESFDVAIGGAGGEIELQNDLAAYAVGFLPLNDRLEIFARLGYGRTDIKASAANIIIETEADSVNFGLGTTVSFDSDDGIRLDWTRRSFKDDLGDADLWSLSYVKRF